MSRQVCMDANLAQVDAESGLKIGADGLVERLAFAEATRSTCDRTAVQRLAPGSATDNARHCGGFEFERIVHRCDAASLRDTTTRRT
ncbi:hypothetical protein [Mycobacterium sp.]|uniref:hypothetical protein n=1 Tax=Mycobacterium sp. TaxID=1785 RepID=UPI002CDD275F|nr:hypothetical protein [Mycobacterium sp.]HTY32929.1 hypothetical protein [Mycobacterium sp.]